MNLLRWNRQFSSKKYFEVEQLEEKIRPFMHLHCHDYAEFFLVKKGLGRHAINGGDESITKGRLIIIRPYADTHRFIDIDGNLSLLHIAVRSSSIRFLESRYDDQMFSFWNETADRSRAIDLSQNQQNWIELVSNQLAKASQNRFEIEKFLMDLVTVLRYPREHLGFFDLSEWLKYACEKIHDPRYFAMGCQGLISLTNRSHEHVARELKRHLGKTPTQIVNHARMNFAAEMLRSSTRPIIDIAFDCGFASLSHFYKLFKDEYGLSPLCYRKINEIVVSPSTGAATVNIRRSLQTAV